jgi:hypothetical protein
MKHPREFISDCLYGLDSLLSAFGIRRHIYLEIANNLGVSSEWIDITPQKPLTAKKDCNEIFLSIDGYLYNHEKPFDQIKMPDGTVVKPEIQMVDQDGIAYPMTFGCRVGNSLGFRGVPSTKRDRSVRNRVYMKVGIRSDKPVTLSKVSWVCSDMK